MSIASNAINVTFSFSWVSSGLWLPVVGMLHSSSMLTWHHCGHCSHYGLTHSRWKVTLTVLPIPGIPMPRTKVHFFVVTVSGAYPATAYPQGRGVLTYQHNRSG